MQPSSFKLNYYSLKKRNVTKDHLIRRSRRYANSQCAMFSTAKRKREGEKGVFPLVASRGRCEPALPGPGPPEPAWVLLHQRTLK